MVTYKAVGKSDGINPMTPAAAQPTPYSRVQLTDAFWAPRIATNGAQTLPA